MGAAAGGAFVVELSGITGVVVQSMAFERLIRSSEERCSRKVIFTKYNSLYINEHIHLYDFYGRGAVDDPKFGLVSPSFLEQLLSTSVLFELRRRLVDLVHPD
ncbi:unnamed protein product [Nippostrongylus brasiliensis]|uniref:Protein kinase domain-containing protein n=1 Tax=Nippostrongylus brasiliensis TaxID=27835 RepID=A0A0N4YWJ5_NIPBR|nr:unnamed protein product [Nippostrongylus brasiliensis]